jgi:hypothetical protein
VEQAVGVSRQTEGLQHSPAELMASGRKPDAGSAQQSGDFSHSKAAAIVTGSESVAEAFRQKQSEDPFEQLGRAASEGIQERARSLPVPEFRTTTASERIILAEPVAADRRDANLWRRLTLPVGIADWPLTSLQQRLVKTGRRLVKHVRYY